MGSLFWKPFDDRFKEMLEVMELHRDLVDREIILLQIQKA